jgi:RNase P subunit RPR2
MFRQLCHSPNTYDKTEDEKRMTEFIFDCPSCGESLPPDRFKIGYKKKPDDEGNDDVEYYIKVVCKECGFAPRVYP